MNAGHSSADAVLSSDRDFRLERILVDFSNISAATADFVALTRSVCEKVSALFGVQGVYCWQIASENELEPVAAFGVGPDEFGKCRLQLQPGMLAVDAIRNGRTLFKNFCDTTEYPFAAGQAPKSVMAVPLLFANQVVGLVGLAHFNNAEYFTDDLATRATVAGALFASTLHNERLVQRAKEEQWRADTLVSTAVELNSSLRLNEFVQKFTSRARSLMGAQSAVLALSQANVLEIVACQGSAPTERSLLRPLCHALAQAIAGTEGIRFGTAAELLGKAIAAALPWNDVTLTRLRSPQGELIGVLCLCDRGARISAADRSLLQALASYASVALENSRLFTRMDHANRHWVDIFDSISDFIVVHDELNHVLRLNRSFADFIGVRPSELIGVSMRALSMTDDGDEPCPFCRAGLDSSDEYIHPLSERTYLISTSRIHGATNEGMQVIHVLKDISDRREAERRYRELFDNIQEGLYFSSPEGRFIEVNDALVRMLGYDSREELLQVDIPTQIYLSPEHCERIYRAMAASGVLRNFESALRRKDGTLIYTLQNAFAVRDGQGRTLQYRGLMMDITELKNFQAELQRERDFSSKILNNTQSLILVVDTAGLISYANRRCYQAGNFKDTNLLGRSLTDIVAPNRRDVMAAALQATLEGKQVDNLELPIALASGHVAQFSTNLSPMRDEQGNVSSIVVVMTDVTDAAMLQAKLVHTEKMAAVGQLVSGVAHEVNNPLTAVLGFSDLLLEQPDVPETAKRDIRIILQEAQRTRQIVQNLLSFARQTPPKRQSIQINDIVRRTLALRAYDFANRDVTIVESLDDALPEIVGDGHQLQQVFLNILNNAYDAVTDTGRPGRIEIQTLSSNGCAEIRFRDNGSGIKHPDRIFDPFFTTKGVGKGTGLGLSICYGIVREHGGEILCSNNEGPSATGATFVVRLPLTTAAGARAFGAQA